jgi:acetyl esterase/lipase
MSYLRRQLITSAFVANAVRPVPGVVASVPAMFSGWLVSELAPHFIAGTAVDTLLEVTRRRQDPRHALLGVANMTALGFVLHQGSRSHRFFEGALSETLGEDYRESLTTDHDLDWRTPLKQLVWPFRMPTDHLGVHKDVPFIPEHGKRGLLDIYCPPGDVRDAPVLLQVHGGGWTIGTKDQQGLPLMRHLAARGWVCVAINYRLSPRDPFPAHIVDVKRAIAWIHEHIAEYGGDPGFVAITGGSAGGHLTALAALTANDPAYQPGFEDADTTVQAAVPFYGIYDFVGVTGVRSARFLRDFFLAPFVFQRSVDDDRQAYEQASPILRVRKDAPPFYVIHGSNDVLAEVDQARQFVHALREASDNPVAYSELTFTQHAFDVFPSVRSQHSVRGVERFLAWALARHRGEDTGETDASWDTDRPAESSASRAT